jgi:hypothetical protein
MHAGLPKLLEGRAMEQYRFFTRRPTPMRIPIFDQACLKYLFTDSFDDKVDPMEWVTAISFIASILVNASSAISNLVEATNGVDSSDPNNPLDQQWIIELSKVVFAVEFAVIFGMLIGLIATIVHAAYHRNIGTDLATDVVALGQRIAGFSSIKIVGWVSPAFASRLIMPHVKAATDWRKRFRVVLYILAYIGGCALATATVTLKVTQIAFTGTTPIGDWTSAQWLSLIGFVMNLAKVDDSYFAETKVLLCAVHEHFCSPGEPTDEFPSSETLFSRVLRYLDIPRETYYEYFEVVFDYHSALPEPKKAATEAHVPNPRVPSPQQQNPCHAHDGAPMLPKRHKRNPGQALASIFTAQAPSESSSLWAQFLRFMNFFTFILKIDNYLLRKFLQMSSSPLLFYEQGRRSFMQAYEDNDIVGMNLALWRSDPDDRNTVQWGLKHEQCFNIVFRCDEGIRIVRPENMDAAGHAQPSEMEASGSLRLPLSSMEIINLLASGRHIAAPAKAAGQRSTPTSALMRNSLRNSSSPQAATFETQSEMPPHRSTDVQQVTPAASLAEMQPTKARNGLSGQSQSDSSEPKSELAGQSPASLQTHIRCAAHPLRADTDSACPPATDAWQPRSAETRLPSQSVGQEGTD